MIEAVQMMTILRLNFGINHFVQLPEKFFLQFYIFGEIGNRRLCCIFRIKLGLMPDLEIRSVFKIKYKNGEEDRQAPNRQVNERLDNSFRGGEQEMFHNCKRYSIYLCLAILQPE